MFIRKTIKKDPLSGKSYSSYYLVESTRTDKGPRQRVLLYMGSEIGLPEGDLTLLSQRIEDIINGQQSFAPYSQEVERLAQTYASQIIRRLSEDVTDSEAPIPSAQFVTIDVNTIKKIRAKNCWYRTFAPSDGTSAAVTRKAQSIGTVCY